MGNNSTNGIQLQVPDIHINMQLHFVSPNKQFKIYACKRFISLANAEEHGESPGPQGPAATFIDTIGRNVCQVATNSLRMCAKCANDSLYGFAAPIGSFVQSFIV